MAAEFELTDAMTAVIGVESSPWPVEVTTTSVRAYARGVGYTDLVYFDEAAAQKAGYASLPMPATFPGTPVFIPGQSNYTFSGPPADTDGPTLSHGLRNVLDGGTELIYERPLVAGERLTVTTTVTNLEVKESKGLGKMLIVTQESRYRDAKTSETVVTLVGQGIFY
jgi:N-terminal half of MaoC dehydratase